MVYETYSPQAAECLIRIAQKQRQLLTEAFDSARHAPRPPEPPKKKLFRPRERTRRETLLLELETLRREAETALSLSNGMRWWHFPWEEIEAILILALEEKQRADGWRFERDIRSFPDQDGSQYVVLFEEGAAQVYSAERFHQYDEVSPYSPQERAERMRHYDRAVYDEYLRQKDEFSSQEKPVRSPLSEKVYRDIDDYYFSEGWMIESIFRSNYRETMYVDRFVQGVSAQATARFRVKALFAVGAYKSDASGKLLAYKSLDYQTLKVVPPDLVHKLSERHIPGLAILKLFEFLAGSDSIRQVPFSSLSRIAGVAETQEDAQLCAIQSAMMTLLADKLIPA